MSRRDGRGGRDPRGRPGQDAQAPREHEKGRQLRGGRSAASPRERGAGDESAGRVLFGVNPVKEALRRRPESIERILLAVQTAPNAELVGVARDAKVAVERVPRERLDALSEGGVHQGVVALLPAFEYAEFETLVLEAKQADRPGLLVVLDGIVDPHNLGAIIRSAHALGAHGVVIAKDRAAQVTGTVSKASAGAVEHCPIARVTNISRTVEALKEEGFWVLAADPEGNQALHEVDLKGPIAIVVGAEGPGIREGVLRHCDFRVRIPMEGLVASLNASVSAAILLYEVLRQRLMVKVP